MVSFTYRDILTDQFLKPFGQLVGFLHSDSVQCDESERIRGGDADRANTGLGKIFYA